MGRVTVICVFCWDVTSLPSSSGVAAVGLASSHNLSLPGAFGSEGSQWEYITILSEYRVSVKLQMVPKHAGGRPQVTQRVRYYNGIIVTWSLTIKPLYETSS